MVAIYANVTPEHYEQANEQERKSLPTIALCDRCAYDQMGDIVFLYFMSLLCEQCQASE